MKIDETDVRLRIYVAEHARAGHRLLYEAIVHEARDRGLAGATVLRGIMGFGADRHLHSAKLVDLSDSLPVVVEIVDREERINTLLPWLDETVVDGFMTVEQVHVVKYRHGS